MEQFIMKTKVYMGKSALEHLKDFQIRRAFIICDPFMAESGMVKRITDCLDRQQAVYEIFSEVVPDPDIHVVTKGIGHMTAFAPDTLIALGGGSAIDTAKAVRYIYEQGTSEKKKCLIAIPTTSGTGSEVTSFSVITDREKNVKYPLRDDAMVPDVALLDLNAEKLCGAEKEARQYAGRTVALPCDISREAEVYAAVSKAEAALGHIDILVNNAAVWRCWDAFVNVSAEEWRKFIDVNLMGTVYCTRAVLPGMLERRYGKIVNVASVAGVYGNANMAHYSATKGAVISLTYALAKEVAEKGICVNCVSPGSVSPAENPDMDYFQESGLSYLGRTGTDNENANLICFLASDEASYISGQNIQIDGCRRKL